MKKYRYYLAGALLLLASACDVSYNDFIDGDKPYGNAVDVNPGFDNTGFQAVTTLSNYTSQEHQVVFSRTYGVSKEVKVQLSVSEAILSEYNQLYETDYQLLPKEYYDMPTETVFPEFSQNADFTVTFYPEKLTQAVGLAAARKYVLPIKASTTQEGVSMENNLTETLLHVAMENPTLTVEVSAAVTPLSFIYEGGFSEEIEFTSAINFKGVDGSKITVTGRQSDVDAYNLANGTRYELLPSANYSFNRIEADEDGGLLYIGGSIDANNLDPDKQYLLPALVQANGYDVVQSNPIYITVDIVELNLSIVNAGSLIHASSVVKTITGKVDVSLNSLFGEDLTVAMHYNPDLISDFNASRGTSYEPLPANLLSIQNQSIAAGSKETSVLYSINMNNAPKAHYLVPLVLQEAEQGSIAGDSVIYIAVINEVASYTFNLSAAYDESYTAVSQTLNKAEIANAFGVSQDELTSLFTTVATSGKRILLTGINGDGSYALKTGNAFTLTGADEFNYTANAPGVWCDASGTVCNWGGTNCAYFCEFKTNDYICNLGQFPGGTQVGNTYTIRIQLLCYDGDQIKSVTCTFNMTITQ